MITIFKQPTQIHSSGANNYWAFQSDMRFAPRFNIRANVVDCVNSALLNSLLLPTNPQSLSVFDAASVLPDFVDIDPKPFILSASQSSQARQYKIELSESFRGLYIYGTTSTGTIANFDVVNNDSIFNIGTPSSIQDIGFVGGVVTTPVDNIYILNYGTASNGLVNSIQLSQSPTQSIAVTASIGVSFGYIVPTNIGVFSIGATAVSTCKWAILGQPDYLDWNEGNDYSNYIMNSTSSQFLTNFTSQSILRDEWATLSIINGSASMVEITDNLGLTYSKSIPSGVRIDIPTGTKNLQIDQSATSYKVVLKNSLGATVSVPMTFNIDTSTNNRGCASGSKNPLISNVRLMWLNDLGGWDYFTFKWVEEKRRVIERERFYKNLNWQSTKKDRGLTQYKTEDWLEWILVSDPVSDEISNVIGGLFTSSDVYLIYNDSLVPIEVLTDSHIINTGWDNNQVRCEFRLSRENR